jgi:hypothetical protein
MIKNEEFQDEIGDNHVSLSAKKSVEMMLLTFLMMKN